MGHWDTYRQPRAGRQHPACRMLWPRQKPSGFFPENGSTSPTPRKPYWIFLDDSNLLERQWGIGIRIDNHGPGGSIPPAGCFGRVKSPPVFSLRMVPPHPPQESRTGFFRTILICLSASDNLGTYGAYSAPPNQGHCPWTQ